MTDGDHLRGIAGSLLLCAVTVLSLFASASPSDAGDLLYTVSPIDDNLRIVDPFTGQTLSTIQLSVTNATIQQCNGLALEPGSNDLYVMLRLVGVTGRSLGKVDVSSGIVTTVGTTGQKFAGITFDASGTLFGVTGDGATTPETLYTINLTNAQTSLVTFLGAGDCGEAIAYDPVDKLIYHASGLGRQNQNEFFDKVNPATKVIANIPLSGDDYEEATALLHLAGGNFLLADLCDELFLVSDKGVVSFLSATDHTIKGMAYLPTGATGAYNRLYGFGCSGPSGHIPMLFGTGTPSAGGTASMAIANGPGGAGCVLVFGVGSLQAPLSPGCVIQIAPLTPTFIPLTLSGTGAGNGRTTFSFQLPPNIIATGYWQAGVFEGNTITLTNPIQMRVL